MGTPNRNYVLPPSLNRVRKNSAIQAHDEKQNNFETKLLKTLPMSFGLFLPLVCDAMSDVDGIEIAELPPPYVPVFFRCFNSCWCRSIDFKSGGCDGGRGCAGTYVWCGSKKRKGTKQIVI